MLTNIGSAPSNELTCLLVAAVAGEVQASVW